MKKLLSILVVVAILSAMAVPAFGFTWTDGFGFHCNNAKGNGKVVTGFEKANIGLTRVGDTTTWNLDIILDNECPSCKRIDWVTFSNKNGAINGKNIQVNHSANPVYKASASADLVLIDTVVDCEGNFVSGGVVSTVAQSGVFATNASAVFTFDIPEGYEIIKGENPVVITFAAAPGQVGYGKVVAEKIITLGCECEDEDNPGFSGGDKGVICDPCSGNNPGPNNNHSNCRTNLRPDHSQFMLFCACPCNG